MGVPFLAPVAKRAYFECMRIGRVSTHRFERAFRLIEVESTRVGRDLLKGLREGRVGLIYVDGNMGPDGHKVEEGGVEVDFFGRRIRVKEGIARLAHGLDYPSCRSSSNRRRAATVSCSDRFSILSPRGMRAPRNSNRVAIT